MGNPQAPLLPGTPQQVLRALQGQAIRAASAVLDRLSVSGDIDCQNLLVRGRISPTQIPTNAGVIQGPLPISVTFTKQRAESGLIVMVGASAFTTVASSLITLSIALDGNNLGVVSNFFLNNANEHHAFPWGQWFFQHGSASLPQGTHTLLWSLSGTGASSDANDYLSYGILELL